MSYTHQISRMHCDLTSHREDGAVRRTGCESMATNAVLVLAEAQTISTRFCHLAGATRLTSQLTPSIQPSTFILPPSSLLLHSNHSPAFLRLFCILRP